ncbi:PAS domain-containing protein [Roseococcus sp. DSY-14]|uniref:PAS domain-containing protein n=1 Tax=Roseococcus sp. DSY-14 TaxID=3369650 RepID=UPI00387B2CA5
MAGLPSTATDAEISGVAAQLGPASGFTDPFSVAVRITRMPMVISDPRLPDNPIVFVNDSFCRLSGYAREEILGRNCRFLQGPDTDPAARAAIREAVRAGRPIEADLKNYRKDGSPFWNRLMMVPVRAPDGAVTHFVASQVDVTLERERMAGLEESNAALLAELADRNRRHEADAARLRLAVDAGQLGEWELDLATDRSVRAPRHDAIFGYAGPVAEWGFARFLAHVLPEDRAVVEESFAAAVRSARPWRFECRIRRADNGETRWIRVQGAPVAGADGRPTKLVGLVQDVTEQHEAQEALRHLNRTLEARVGAALAERKLLADILEGNSAFVQVVGRDWRFLALNRAVVGEYERVFGVRPRVGDDLREVLAHLPAESDGALALWSRALAGEEFTATTEFGDPGRARRTYEMSFSTLRDAEGRFIGAYQFSSDVTDRLRDTERLAQAEESLRQSQKMEALGQLTGGIAHDFNNMLQAVMAALQLMQRRIETGRAEEAVRFVEAAQQQVTRAAGITHRLLSFARRQALSPERVNLDALVRGLEDLLRQTVGPSIRLDIALHDGVWPVRCDSNGLENALLNLVINARDAMPGGGTLRITTAHEVLPEGLPDAPAAGEYVRLSVQDDGLGMDAEVLRHAFEPFFTTKPAGKGTGLGLSQVYGFARQSGGTARLESAPGRGTSVHLLLARAPAEARPPPVPAGTGTPGTAAAATVLLVEDEPDIRAFAAQALRDHGLQVIEAADGRAALSLLRGGGVAPMRRPDLLLADVGLPGGLNGRQLAEAVREHLPGLPVLLITGYAGGAIPGDDLPEGFEVLPKPFTLDLLLERVREALRR